MRARRRLLARPGADRGDGSDELGAGPHRGPAGRVVPAAVRDRRQAQARDRGCRQLQRLRGGPTEPGRRGRHDQGDATRVPRNRLVDDGARPRQRRRPSERRHPRLLAGRRQGRRRLRGLLGRVLGLGQRQASGRRPDSRGGDPGHNRFAGQRHQEELPRRRGRLRSDRGDQPRRRNRRPPGRGAFLPPEPELGPGAGVRALPRADGEHGLRHRRRQPDRAVEPRSAERDPAGPGRQRLGAGGRRRELRRRLSGRGFGHQLRAGLRRLRTDPGSGLHRQPQLRVAFDQHGLDHRRRLGAARRLRGGQPVPRHFRRQRPHHQQPAHPPRDLGRGGAVRLHARQCHDPQRGAAGRRRARLETGRRAGGRERGQRTLQLRHRQRAGVAARQRERRRACGPPNRLEQPSDHRVVEFRQCPGQRHRHQCRRPGRHGRGEPRRHRDLRHRTGAGRQQPALAGRTGGARQRRRDGPGQLRHRHGQSHGRQQPRRAGRGARGHDHHHRQLLGRPNEPNPASAEHLARRRQGDGGPAVADRLRRHLRRLERERGWAVRQRRPVGFRDGQPVPGAEVGPERRRRGDPHGVRTAAPQQRANGASAGRPDGDGGTGVQLHVRRRHRPGRRPADL